MSSSETQHSQVIHSVILWEGSQTAPTITSTVVVVVVVATTYLYIAHMHMRTHIHTHTSSEVVFVLDCCTKLQALNSLWLSPTSFWPSPHSALSPQMSLHR